MKTPRDLLLKRHHAAGPKLDRIRHEVLNRELRAAVVSETRRAEAAGFPWHWLTFIRREVLQPFRWHLAGMSTAWLITVFLNLDPATEVGIARTDGPSPRQILASLRENRRQITELTGPPVQAGEAIPAPRMPAPRRRSESVSNCAMA